MKVEVDLKITNPITSNNVLKSLEHKVLPIRGYFLCNFHHNQYYAVLTNLQTASSFSFPLPDCFFIFACVISHKFVLDFLRKPCGFFLRFLMGRPLLLFLSQRRSKGCFILRQMTLSFLLVCHFTNFVFPLPATYLRRFQDNC